MKKVEGGVCAPQGFVASGIHAGIRKDPAKKDLALIYSETPCVAAGVTTQNLTCAAPVKLTRKHLASPTVQAIICNSGNANACTENGMEVAETICQMTAEALQLAPEQVLVSSTGVIGVPMDPTPIKQGMSSLVEQLSSQGSDACAHAIMTTDTQKKEIAVTFDLEGHPVTIGGVGKGSGMIHPNMATMLGFITTDAVISKELLQKAVSDATDQTFNMVSVDGATSTNDMVLVLANGLADNPSIGAEGKDYDTFYQGLLTVFTTLAIAVAADGEGASKLITCNITGAEELSQARILAKSVIGSDLVKAAFFGEDANWGRILSAMGSSGTKLETDEVSIGFSSKGGQVQVCQGGNSLPFSETKAKKVLAEDAITLDISVGQGAFDATAWGCDLTYEYVKINGAYRS